MGESRDLVGATPRMAWRSREHEVRSQHGGGSTKPHPSSVKERPGMRHRISAWWSAPVLGALSTTASAQLTIHLTLDPSVTGDPRSSQIQSAMNYVATQYHTNYSDPITVNILVV